MPATKTQTLTAFRDHIYDQVETPGITALTRSGQFTGLFVSLGSMEPKLAERFHQIVLQNPKHGVQILLDNIKAKP